MEVTPPQAPVPQRGIMVAFPCPMGHAPEVIKVPAEGWETALDVYFRLTKALQTEGVRVPLHYQPYGYAA